MSVDAGARHGRTGPVHVKLRQPSASAWQQLGSDPRCLTDTHFPLVQFCSGVVASLAWQTKHRNLTPTF